MSLWFSTFTSVRVSTKFSYIKLTAADSIDTQGSGVIIALGVVILLVVLIATVVVAILVFLLFR